MKPDLRPMLATLTDKPFDDPDWIFETKWDGFRLMAEIKDGSVALYSRNLIDLSRKYPSVCAALRGLHRFAVIDGELVALDARGRSRFQLLQNAEREKVRLRYCAFDLIYLDDQDLRDHPLIERKELLEKILPRDPLLHYSAHVWDKGIAAFKRASRAGEEGVMAKFCPRSLLLRPAHAGMAEGQSLAWPGGGHCRLHRAAAVAGIFRLARACRARGRCLALCRPRRNRLRPRVAQIPARADGAAHHQDEARRRKGSRTRRTPPGSSPSLSAR